MFATPPTRLANRCGRLVAVTRRQHDQSRDSAHKTHQATSATHQASQCDLPMSQHAKPPKLTHLHKLPDRIRPIIEGPSRTRMAAFSILLVALVALSCASSQAAEAAATTECNADIDCAVKDKICHENKCICPKDRPIEDQNQCLSTSLINETCSVNEQCLGYSHCVEGVCTCGPNSVSLYNPSNKLNYCHPKRRLNQPCSHDQQCPDHSYCASEKYGCLCQNGYGPALVNADQWEREECLPVFCSEGSFCFDPDFHVCQDRMCVCIASHFDPTSGKCYKFGGTGGKPLVETNNATHELPEKKNTHNNYSIFDDLRDTGDKMWLILIICISFLALTILLIFVLIRKYCLSWCWTIHKQEYEPNKSLPNSSLLNKNAINNKSFRKKLGESDDVDGTTSNLTANLTSLVVAADATSTPADTKSLSKQNPGRLATVLVTSSKLDNGNDHLKVNMNGSQTDTLISLDGDSHHLMGPLKTSTSTPV